MLLLGQWILKNETLMILVLTSPHTDFVSYPLTDGEHLVGSNRDCHFSIEHPTVSRHHARIKVENGHASIEDLGSKNGTRVAGKKIRKTTRLKAGQRLALGTLDLKIETMDEGDLVPALTFENPPPPVRDLADEIALTTASLGSLRAFTLEYLPELMRLVDLRSGLPRLAQALGSALACALPVRRVELVSQNPEGGAVLFQACLSESEELDNDAKRKNPLTVEYTIRRVTVRATFLHPVQVKSYSSLLEMGLRLIRLEAESEIKVEPPIAPQGAALPEPTTTEPAIRKIYEDASKVAQGEVSVLITGASGTGKEVLARYLHASSKRQNQPFITLNCAALPRDLLESELFGIERGVATGVEARPGKFELASGGTLFLDEIADMASETQAKILRVLQEREVYRLGARKPRKADVRIVAATNQDVDILLKTGEFRVDLYHRIADWRVDLPPLKERAGDIANLAAYFLQRAAEKRSQAVAGISRTALEMLESHDWPGNVRQLEREMERAILFLKPGQLLESSHLSGDIRKSRKYQGTSLKAQMDAAERKLLEESLAHQPSLGAAARSLEISRSTLYRRLKQLDVDHTNKPNTKARWRVGAGLDA